MLRFFMFRAIGLTLFNFFPKLSFFDRHKFRLLRFLGAKIDGPCTIFGPITIRPINRVKKISIGSSTFINTELRIGGKGNVYIGNNVQIGPRVSIETTNHSLKPINGKRETYHLDVTIKSNVWIGAGVIILPGVTVGENSVIAAGAVVNKNVSPNVLVGGVPAKVLTKL